MCKQNCEKVYILNSLAKFLQMSLPKFIFIIHTVKRWKQIKTEWGDKSIYESLLVSNCVEKKN